MASNIPLKLTNFNLFIEGKGFAGLVSKATLPKITQKTAEHRAGGMMGVRKYSMGLEALEANFTLASFEPEPFRLMGLRKDGPVGLILRGALQHYQEAIPLIATIRGMVSGIDMGDMEVGGETSMSFKVDVVYYKLVRNVETLVEIDIDNNVERYGDFDTQEVIRNILKIS